MIFHIVDRDHSYRKVDTYIRRSDRVCLWLDSCTIPTPHIFTMTFLSLHS